MSEKIEKLIKLFYGHSIVYPLKGDPIKFFGKTIKMQSVKIIMHPYRRLINYDVSGA